MRVRGLCLVLLAGWVSTVGCSKENNIQQNTTNNYTQSVVCQGPAEDNQMCEAAADAPENAVCVYGYCRSRCSSDTDCQKLVPGTICLPGADGTACRLPPEAACGGANAPCPTGLTCTADGCRASCGTSGVECPLEGLTCENGACVGTATGPLADAGAGGSAGSGGAGGSAGAGGGAGATGDAGFCAADAGTNNTEASAQNLGSIDDCDASGGSVNGALFGDTDEAWFAFHAADGMCTAQPVASATAGFSLETCIFAVCDSDAGTASWTCDTATPSTSPGGWSGCCWTSGTPVLQLGCTGTMQDDATFHVRLKAASLGGSCGEYSLSYHY